MPFRNQFFILISLFFVACSTEKSTIPSYIYVNKFKLNTNFISEGDTSIDVQDVWLYQNNEFKGSFGLPAYIPLIEKNKTNLTLRAGVKRSGQDDQRLQYPLFTDYDTTITLANLKSDTLFPVVSYLPNCKFPLIQDYDGNTEYFSIFQKKNGDSIIRISNDQAWKLNNNCVKIQLDDSTYQLNYISKEFQNLPSNGIPIYLEVDYKCTSSFFMGLNVIYTDGTSRGYSVLTANSTNGLWQKIYLDLATEIGTEIAQRGAGTKFQIFFRIEKSGEPLKDNTNLYLDNIKLIHF
jgi:hypothetical protein